MSPYIPQFVGADIPKIGTDIAGGVLKTGVAVAPLIAMGIGYKWLKKKSVLKKGKKK